MMRLRSLLPALLAAAAAACSLLLKEEAGQCHSSRDCAQLGFEGYVCDTRQQVCIEDIELTGGGSGAGSASANGAGGKVASGGSGNEGGDGPSGAGKPSGGNTAMGGGGSGGVATAGSAATAGSGGAPEPPCEPGACTAAGGSCESNVCVIACNVADCAPSCPAGMPCRIECGDDSCKNVKGVDCSKASSCEIQCGTSSCLNGVVCGGSRCAVGCTGLGSCSLIGITCSADVCDLSCTGNQSCIKWFCKEAPSECNVTCGGIQSCGTETGSNAAQTNIACDAAGSCDVATTIALCCGGGAHCSGDFAPTCK